MCSDSYLKVKSTYKRKGLEEDINTFLDRSFGNMPWCFGEWEVAEGFSVQIGEYKLYMSMILYTE